MEQRRPRLGDVVDDYCPRERRLSNHVVVAMVGDAIKQTRCTTCDAEHVYKGAKVPPKRKKPPTTAALVQAVAEGLTEKPRLAADAPAAATEEPAVSAPAAAAPAATAAPVPPAAPAPPAVPEEAAASTAPEAESEHSRDEEGPVHRPLIRATLPRLPGEEREPRPIPEFTMWTARNARGFRHGSGGGRSGGKGGVRSAKGRADASSFRPGAMGAWSPSNQRQRGGGQSQSHGNRQPGQPRPQGHKKSR
jgi:hypothetical protein